MKSTLLFCILFSISICCFAQKHTRTGTVYDEDKNVLADVNVLLKNTPKGIITNKKGQFTLDVSPKDTLVVSYLGFETKEIVVGNQKEIIIILENNLEELDTVLITVNRGKHTICSISCELITTVIDCQFDEKSESKSATSTIKKNTTSLFPNPSATGLFQLQLDKIYNKLTVEVFNMNGQLIQTKTYTKLSKIPQIDLSKQSKGMYLIRTTADGNILETKKAIRN